MKKYLGKTALGRDVYAHTISDGDLSITVMDYGATLMKLVHCGTDIVLGYDTLEAYMQNDGCLGGTIGRYANRISGGKLTIDDIDYPIVKNNGEAHLHGGAMGFHRHTWNVEDGMLPDGTPTLCCGFVSADGEEGYPGRLIATVTYMLKDNSLIIDYKANTNKKTYCCMTNHSYFNLHGYENPSILDHKLTVFADKVTAVDPETLLPIGRRDDVEGTAFDFRTEKEIGADLEKTGLPYPGYDHNFMLRRTDKTRYTSGGGGPFMELVKKSGEELTAAAICRVPEREMTVLTTMPAMQIYTANFLGDGSDLKGGVKQHKHQGVCFETQFEPDSPSHGGALLRPEETYHHITAFRFKKL